MREIFILTCDVETSSKNTLQAFILFLYECRGVDIAENEIEYEEDGSGNIKRGRITLKGRNDWLTARIQLAIDLTGIGKPYHVTSDDKETIRYYHL